MAGVSWAASLDARSAIPARLATLIAVGASSASNGTWAYLRAHHDHVTVALGVAVPIAANLAFEVLLAELRRQVQRKRGLPAPVAIPYPRLIRLILAPWGTFSAWRTVVLDVTEIEYAPQSDPLVLGLATPNAHQKEQPREATPYAMASIEPTSVASTSTQQLVQAEPPVVAQSEPRSPEREASREQLKPAEPDEPDPRVLRLAEIPDIMDRRITGASVGDLLGEPTPARTGRRLLSEARARRRDGHSPSPELYVAAHQG
jgi:hypothetical protein